MASQRLPIPGSDNGTWGSILNGFLEVSHNSDGTLSTSAITTAGAVTSVNNTTPTNGNVTVTANSLGAAPLASPAFTGTPTAPTASPGTNTTQLATTAFTTTAVGALSNEYAAIESGTGWINLAEYPGFVSGTDSTAAVLAAFVAAQGGGANGANLLVMVPPGTTIITSQPVPLYNGFRALGDPLGANTLNPQVKWSNSVTDIFEPPTSATSGTLEEVRISGFYFQGNASLLNTHILTPQPLDSSGWGIYDFYFIGNSWKFFKSALVGSFLRAHIRGFNGNNCSGQQLVLYGSDSEIGIERSYLDSFLIGNIARWSAYSNVTTYTQLNIVYVADGNGNQYYYQLSLGSSTGTAPSGTPASTYTWIYLATYLASSSGATAYSGSTAYSVGNLVSYGGQHYYCQAATTGNTPPGTSTGGAYTSNTYWLWIDTSLGNPSSGQYPMCHIVFSMQQSLLTNVYPTMCPNSAIQITGTCTGSIVAFNECNGYEGNRFDNSGSHLPGSDAEGIWINQLTGIASNPGPTGLFRLDSNTITNAGQNGFGAHSGGILLNDSQRVGMSGNMFVFDSWTGGPSVTTATPYRLVQSAATTRDIVIDRTRLSTGTTTLNNGLTTILSLNGTITNVQCDDFAVTGVTTGTHTIGVHCPPWFVSGGTVNLPNATYVTPGQSCAVTNTSSSPFSLTSAGGNINNGTTLSIPAYSSVVCYSDGTNWWAT